MVKAHHRAFVDLYLRLPGALKTVMQNKRSHTNITQDIFRRPDSGDVLLFYKEALDRFGNLERQCHLDALILIGDCIPRRRAEDFQKDVLTMPGARL